MYIMSLHAILCQLHHSLHGVPLCKLRLPISLHVLPYHPIPLITTITLSNLFPSLLQRTATSDTVEFGILESLNPSSSWKTWVCPWLLSTSHPPILWRWRWWRVLHCMSVYLLVCSSVCFLSLWQLIIRKYVHLPVCLCLRRLYRQRDLRIIRCRQQFATTLFLHHHHLSSFAPIPSPSFFSPSSPSPSVSFLLHHRLHTVSLLFISSPSPHSIISPA